MRKLVASAICLASLFSNASMAYDADTHAVMMYLAFQRSVLGEWHSSEVLTDLGLNLLTQAGPFDTYWYQPPILPYYFDDLPILDPVENPLDYPAIYPENLRSPNHFERCVMQQLKDNNWLLASDPMLVGESVQHLPIQNWLIRGDVREDDLPELQYRTVAIEVCGEPDIDPHGAITRVLNHFYDPVRDVALTSGCTLAPGGVCQKMVDWALGNVDSFALVPVVDQNRRNHFSYADARDNMWLALLGERHAADRPYSNQARSDDAQERLWRWATAFRALGDVVHLLQDGAQPQHVRNDAHSFFQSGERRAFEGYTNARVYAGQDISTYVRSFFGGESVPRPPRLVTDAYGVSYGIPQFSTPLRFFTTREREDGPDVRPDNRYGLADYANRGFFTGGTLPGSGPGSSLLEPPQPIDEDSFYTESTAPCRISEGLALRIFADCRHWTHAVPDSVQGYVDELPHEDGQPSAFSEPPLVAESLFYSPVAYLQNGPPKYSLGLEEFQNMANLAVPRAIAYSAGLINYFFRGRIEVTPPPDGLYAVVDQGTPHTVSDGIPLLDDGTNKVFGFTTIRVRAKNATGNANGEMLESGTDRGVPQDMHGKDIGDNHFGMIVAVARYHRNPCYHADLSGERSFQEPADPFDATIPAGCNAPAQQRTPNAEISVSYPIYIDENGNLVGTGNSPNPCANLGNINTGVGSAHPECGASNDPALLEFDFSNDPIPINATDLYLQVAYRGPIGEEQDGIAVGFRDILEPAYYTLLNTTDWFLYNNQWILPGQAPGGVGADPDSLNLVEFCLHGQQIAHLKVGQVLPAGQFARIAILSEQQDLYMGTIARFSRDDPSARLWTYLGPPSSDLVRESTQDNGGIYDNDPMYYGRGTTLGFGHSFMFHYYPDADLTGVHYDEMWTRTPTLGAAGAPGIAAQIETEFTGMSDDGDCAATYGGQWPSAYFAPAGDGLSVKSDQAGFSSATRARSTGAAASSRQ